MRRTSMSVKEVVDQMRLPTVVRLSRSFFLPECLKRRDERVPIDDSLVQNQLNTGQLNTYDADTETIAGVLTQSPSLTHLFFSPSSLLSSRNNCQISHLSSPSFIPLPFPRPFSCAFCLSATCWVFVFNDSLGFPHHSFSVTFFPSPFVFFILLEERLDWVDDSVKQHRF